MSVCAAVAGDPIVHSLTPTLFGLVAQHLRDSGITIEFEAKEKIQTVSLVDALAWGHARNESIARASPGADIGSREVWISVTTPLKHQMPYDGSTEWVLGNMLISSVNHLRHDGHVWRASSTDGQGLVMLAEEFGFDFGLIDYAEKPLLCLTGGGSTARSCAAAWAESGGLVWQMGGRRKLPSRGPWKDSMVDASEVCDIVGRRLEIDFDQAPGTEPEVSGEQAPSGPDAPLYVSATYSQGDWKSEVETEWGYHLDGRWLLAAQHLVAWRYLFFPEAADDLPTLRELMLNLEAD